MIAFEYVDSQKKLDECCKRLQHSPVLSVDTEFVRERTFFPRPGLVQVSDAHQISLIDPISCANLQPFFALLESPDIQIVMHSCSEDIELFYFMGCGTIHGLFDTQIAAAWLGMGHSLSLQRTVEHYESVFIEKQLSRTDWLKRPLSDAQLEYAAIDVLYLHAIAKQQQASLREAASLDFMLEDCDLCCEKKSLSENDNLAYLKVSRAITATDEALNRLQQLSSWREQRARKDDRPRQHVLKDLQLLSICMEYPETLDQLAEKCEIPTFVIRRYGAEIINVITESCSQNTVTKPVLSLRSISGGGKVLKDCRDFMVDIHLQEKIPLEVLPSKRWLEQFLLHSIADWYSMPDGWKGWRKNLLEEPLQRIIKENDFKLRQE